MERKPDWTLVQEVSGEAGLNRHFLFKGLQPKRPNRSEQLTASYCRHEQEKRRADEQRVREVERASFTPLEPVVEWARQPLFSTNGWQHSLAQKQRQSYSTTMGWPRTALSFALLR